MTFLTETHVKEKMLFLFGGNMEAYGLDQFDGRGMAVHETVTSRLMEQHLDGDIGIGIYPMWLQDGVWWTKWGCCDIDTGDWDEAYRLAATLRAMGLVPHVERSRSKGWHVWVFASERVPAAQMRRALKVAYATIGLQAKEANPKAEELREGQLGNYVRLPYKSGMVMHVERQCMMASWGEATEGKPIQAKDWFADFCEKDRTDKTTIEYWAKKWVEPVKHRYTEPKISEEQLKLLAVNMSQDLFRFLMDGPKNGDRSEALVAFAWKLKYAGYMPDEIFGFIQAADLRWGKYHLRPNGTDYLLDIVERVM